MRRAERDHLRLVQRLFDSSAERYERAIAPVFAPLVADFVAYAAPRTTDHVLDAGTGTGIVARQIAPLVASVVGVDVAERALALGLTRLGRFSLPRPLVAPSPSETFGPAGARQNYGERDVMPPEANGPHFVRADLHHLPFPACRFTLIVASFGFNATDPERSARALRRVLAPGGRIAIQEWGPITPLDQAVADVLADYVVADPPADLAALRDQIVEFPSLWADQMQDTDDYAEWLTDLGFIVEDVREGAPVSVPLDVGAFIAYKLAWTDRAEEVRAMDEPTRNAFVAALHARLADSAEPDGSLRWEPVVIRALGRLPGH